METIRDYLNKTSTRFDTINDQVSRSEFDEISLHLKAIERSTQRVALDPSKSYYFRLDGSSFSKLLNKDLFRKPCEVNMLKAMQITTNKLVDVYKCTIGFCQSDEISLGLYPRVDRHGKIIPLQDNGNYNKFISEMASLAATKFVSAFQEYIRLDSTIEVSKKEEILRYINNFDMKFDNRLYEGFIPISIYWRMLDCDRNAKNGYSQSILSTKQLERLSTEKALEEAEQYSITKYLELPLKFRKGYLTTRGLRREVKETEFEELQRLYPNVQLSKSEYIRMKQWIKKDKKDKNKIEEENKNKNVDQVINVKDIISLIEGKETITLNQITSLIRYEKDNNISTKTNIHTFVDLRLIDVYDYLMNKVKVISTTSTISPNEIEMFDSILDKLFELDTLVEKK
jgi:tRNA(His) 5'-end guanylyltransferase